MRKLSIAAIASASVIFIVLLVTPGLIPTDIVKAKLTALFKERTGRDLRIDGPLRLSLFPHLGLVLTGVTLPSPTRDFKSDLLQAESVRASFKYLPLLRGRIEIERFELTRPAFHFEIDKEGRRNWVFHRPEQPQRAMPSSANDTGFTVIMPDLAILHGTADYLDQRSGRRFRVTNLDLELSRPGPSAPANIKGEATWNGQTVTVDATSAAPKQLWQDGTGPLAFHLFSAPVAADFTGEVDRGPSPGMTGAIHVDAPSLRALVEWLGWRFPVRGGGFGHFVLHGRIEATRARLHLTDAAILLDSSTAQGTLSLRRDDPRPTLSGHLEIAVLDLDPYFKHKRAAMPTPPDGPPDPLPSPKVADAKTGLDAETGEGGGSGPPRAARPPHWNTAPIDLKPLQLVDADLTLNANTVHFRNLKLDNSTFGLHLDHGRLMLDLAAMRLYRGTANGTLIADGTGGTLAVNTDLELHGIAAGPLLAGIAGFDQLAGTGDISVAVSGTGRSEKEIVSSLSGKCRIDLRNGSFSSLGLVNLTRNFSGPFAYTSPKTIQFQSLSGSGTITGGILHNADLKIASPKMSVLGSGTVDLISHSLDYLWRQQLPKLGSAQVLITGPWSAPSYKVKSVSINGGLLAPLAK